MNAHVLDANGKIINTIVVDSLDQFGPAFIMVDASIGGSIGDSVIAGQLIKAAPQAEQQ